MSIENDLRKDGITVIQPLDTLSVTLIAKYVAEKYISYFPFSRMRYNDLYAKIARLNMYVANIPEGLAEASYFFKNDAIYFKDGLSIEKMQELAIHEFMHHYQQKKDKNNVLYRLGLCDYTNLKIHGNAINEAAVQLISSNILKNQTENVKYYGIAFPTVSPDYYSLLCNLINQMAYITGYDILVDSTLNANDKFKNCFIKLCGKKTYTTIENNFEKILELESQVSEYDSTLMLEDLSEREIRCISLKVKKIKETINNTFIRTQNLIFTSYFDSELKNLYSIQDIENYREKLYTYKDYIGIVENYSYFNEYYINMMANLEVVRESIETTTSITIYKKSKFQIAFAIIANLFGRPFETENAFDK